MVLFAIAVLFFDFRLVAPEMPRSLVLVRDVSDRVSSTIRDLAGGIVVTGGAAIVLFHVYRDWNIISKWSEQLYH